MTTVDALTNKKIKHIGDGMYHGHNGTRVTVVAQLMQTLMAIYARIDFRDTVFSSRTPTSKNEMRYDFVLPANSSVISIENIEYDHVSIEVSRESGRQSSQSKISTYTTVYGKSVGYSVEKNERNKIDGVTHYTIKIDKKTYTEYQSDFFCNSITWMDANHKQHKSFICYFKDTPLNISRFTSDYLKYKLMGCIGRKLIGERGFINIDKNGNVNYAEPEMVNAVVTHPVTEVVGSSYKFRELDYLMLPSLREHDGKRYITSMNDFSGEEYFDNFSKYIIATANLYHELMENVSDSNLSVEERYGINTGVTEVMYARSMLNKYIKGIDIYAEELEETEEVEEVEELEEEAAEEAEEEASAEEASADANAKGADAEDAEADTMETMMIISQTRKSESGSGKLEMTIYIYCKDVNYNNILFGAIPLWHTDGIDISSYGNGSFSSYFVKKLFESTYDSVITETDGIITREYKHKSNSPLWGMMSDPQFKDGVFCSVFGLTSNMIEDALFADAVDLRSKAACNTTYFMSIVYNQRTTGKKSTSVFTDEKKAQISGIIAGVYREVFADYIEFLHSADGLTAFKDPDPVRNAERQEDIKNYDYFRRILQYPPVIDTKRSDILTTKQSVKLVTTVSTVKYFNKIVRHDVKNQPFCTFRRADGGLFLTASDINIGRESTSARNDYNKTNNVPYCALARSIFNIMSFIGNNATMFPPCIVEEFMINIRKPTAASGGGKATAIAALSSSKAKQDSYYEINVKYDQVIGPVIEKSFHRHVGLPGRTGNFSDDFVASPAEYSSASILGVPNAWKDYVTKLEFLADVIGEGHGFIQTGNTEISYVPSFELGLACRLTCVDLNIYDLYAQYNVPLGENELWDRFSEYIPENRNELRQMVVKKLLTVLDQGNARTKIENAESGQVSDQILIEALQETCPRLFRNFYECAPIESKSIRFMFMIAALLMKDNNRYTQLDIINAYLLIADFRTKSTDLSFMSKNNYMAMSASVYLYANRNDTTYKLDNIATLYGERIKSDKRTRDSMRSAPIFANIANVPIFYHGNGKIYLHLLNDVCSNHVSALYHFIRALTDENGISYNFEWVNGYVKPEDIKKKKEQDTDKTSSSIADKKRAEAIAEKLDEPLVLTASGKPAAVQEREALLPTSIGDMVNIVRTTLGESNHGRFAAATEQIRSILQYGTGFLDALRPSEANDIQHKTKEKVAVMYANHRVFYMRNKFNDPNWAVRTEDELIRDYINGIKRD